MVRKGIVYLMMIFMFINCKSKVVDKQCTFEKDDVMLIKLQDERLMLIVVLSLHFI